MGHTDNDKAFRVSWDQFHRDARVLAWRLGDKGPDGKPFQAIVSVTRGGLVPAAVVARELDIRLIETICVVSYKGNREQAQSNLELLKPIGETIRKIGNGRGYGVLVVDDLTDTGLTAKFVRDQLPDAHFAAVYAKPKGAPLIDTWVTEVSQDTWIYFPWDLGLAYQPPMGTGVQD